MTRSDFGPNSLLANQAPYAPAWIRFPTPYESHLRGFSSSRLCQLVSLSFLEIRIVDDRKKDYHSIAVTDSLSRDSCAGVPKAFPKLTIMRETQQRGSQNIILRQCREISTDDNVHYQELDQLTAPISALLYSLDRNNGADTNMMRERERESSNIQHNVMAAQINN